MIRTKLTALGARMNANVEAGPTRIGDRYGAPVRWLGRLNNSATPAKKSFRIVPPGSNERIPKSFNTYSVNFHG